MWEKNVIEDYNNILDKKKPQKLHLFHYSKKEERKRANIYCKKSEKHPLLTTKVRVVTELKTYWRYLSHLDNSTVSKLKNTSGLVDSNIYIYILKISRKKKKNQKTCPAIT